MIFLTVEDKTGDANMIVWENVGETYKQAVYSANLVLITGYVQREGEVVHIGALKTYISRYALRGASITTYSAPAGGCTDVDCCDLARAHGFDQPYIRAIDVSFMLNFP